MRALWAVAPTLTQYPVAGTGKDGYDETRMPDYTPTADSGSVAPRHEVGEAR